MYTPSHKHTSHPYIHTTTPTIYSSFTLAPIAAHGRLLTPHTTPTALLALLRRCLRIVNLAAYIREFLRRVWAVEEREEDGSSVSLGRLVLGRWDALG